MNRVYVAGPYSGNTFETLTNMRKGMRKSTELLLKGYAPFCPWLDYQYTLMCRDNEEVTYQMYLAMSIAWLEVSDAVLLLEGWENSKGTLAEIERANILGIPVFLPTEEEAMETYFNTFKDGNKRD